jgi:enhancing lycopene biosynthesis protein 2
MAQRVAVILSGCGYLDGSEIREAVGALWALSKEGAEVQCFAPSGDQPDVIDHLTGTPSSGEYRNMLRESARIARGKIKPLSEYDVKEFDALVMPGGFGAAKNLSTFATDGAKGTVDATVQEAIRQTHGAGKPICAICIAPAVVALALSDKKLQLTVGESGGAAQNLEKVGHEHVERDAHEWHVDEENKIVTTPAYMYDDAPLHKIFEGIEGAVKAMLSLI